MLSLLDLNPKKMQKGVPVIFAPGWSNSPRTVSSSLSILVEEGRRVISLAHSRRNEIIEIEEGPEGVGKEELQKALALLGVLKGKAINEAILVGYSDGGIYGLIAALICPEKIKSIILVDPAGVTEEKSVFRMLIKLAKEAGVGFLDAIRNSNLWRPLGRIIKDLLEYVFKNPLMSYRELLEIYQANTLNMLIQLRNKGIRITVVFGEDDEVLSMKEAQKRLQIGKHIDEFIIAPGGHAEIISRPQKIMSIVNQKLDVHK